MIQIDLNGTLQTVDAPAEMPLLWVLREHFNLTGAKYGCGHGVCGGCIIQVDGSQVHACQVTAAEVVGRKVVTIEGQQGAIADAVFQAWDRLNVVQCGFCQPAQISSAVILLTHNTRPTDEDINEAMKHNLCRCATYQRIRQAIYEAVDTLSSQT